MESGFKTDGAIIGEPSTECAIGHRGLEWLEVEITGKPATAASPKKGVNAIVNAARFILRVEEKLMPLLKKRPPHMGRR